MFPFRFIATKAQENVNTVTWHIIIIKRLLGETWCLQDLISFVYLLRSTLSKCIISCYRHRKLHIPILFSSRQSHYYFSDSNRSHVNHKSMSRPTRFVYMSKLLVSFNDRCKLIGDGLYCVKSPVLSYFVYVFLFPL